MTKTLVTLRARGTGPAHIVGDDGNTLCGIIPRGYWRIPSGVNHSHVPCSRCNRKYLELVEFEQKQEPAPAGS